MSFTFIFLLTAFLFRENDVNTNWMKFSENEQCSELRFQLAYTWINIFNAKLNVKFVCIVIHGKTGKCQYEKNTCNVAFKCLDDSLICANQRFFHFIYSCCWLSLLPSCLRWMHGGSSGRMGTTANVQEEVSSFRWIKKPLEQLNGRVKLSVLCYK